MRFSTLVLTGTGSQALLELFEHQTVLRLVVAFDLILAANSGVVGARHRELDAIASLEGEIGKTFQLAVALRVNFEKLQASLVVEVALASFGCVLEKTIGSRYHVGLDANNHLLTQRHSEILLGDARNLTRSVKKNFESLNWSSANVIEIRFCQLEDNVETGFGSRTENSSWVCNGSIYAVTVFESPVGGFYSMAAVPEVTGEPVNFVKASKSCVKIIIF